MPAPGREDLIDRVDADDVVIGTVTRGQALQLGAGFRVVHVLVTDDEGRVCLQRIGSDGTRSPGRWGSSVAGYLHAGEEPLDGARRRMSEELGIGPPLQFAGRTVMSDERSRKFIYVYLATSTHAHNMAPGHIADVSYVPIATVLEEIRSQPDAFTKTFPLVLQVARPLWSSQS